MAKLTEDQKAQNKAAMRARNRAYAARLNAKRSAKEASDALIAKTPQAKKRDEVMVAFEGAIEERRRIEADFDNQIQLLQQKKKEAVAAHAARIDELKIARDAAYKDLSALHEQENAKIDSAFPDLEGVYSAAGWKSLDAFMPNRLGGQ